MVRRPLQELDEQLDRVVEATPSRRDRFVDFLRAASIGVVVVWHWGLSLTHWRDGELTMPNPIDAVPGAWLATWVLQVMPLFFFVGGFANHAGWTSVVRDGGGMFEFYRKRLYRLLVPPLAFALLWSGAELVLHAVRTDHRDVLEWGGIVLMPFWFLAAYVWVVALTPVTARLHDRAGLRVALLLGLLVAVVDAGRFGLGIEQLGYVNSALVWVFAHQLGYFYRDGTLLRIGRRGQMVLVVAAAAGLVALTLLDDYPRSMVATREVDVSHMWPTTAAIALVAVLQAGLAMLVRPAVRTWLGQRRVWKAVVAVNAMILTVFVWHMTAKVVFLGAYEAGGFELPAEPTLAWWLQRPLWLLGPAVVLAMLLALFAPLETRAGRR